MEIKLCAPDELMFAAQELSAITQISHSDTAVYRVETQKTDKNGLRLTKTADGITVEYSRTTDFCRALGLLGEFAASSDQTLEQHPAFGNLGYMPDCSHNAVPGMDGAKELLRHLAVMGFNMMMLNTEDTYDIPEYPYFGYMRGKFTKEEIKEIDRYALSLGIELFPCIQTLAHLSQIFRWNCFKSINDIDDILNVADERTYDLIDAILRTCAECYTSRRINLGLDEAHNLGRGKYLDANGGYKKVNQIMHEHLSRLIKMTEKYNFKPMMWSDMFFRPKWSGYYHAEGSLPDELVKSKPDGIMPIYWDYYCDEKTVDNMMSNHEQFGCEFAFAGGAWKWIGFAPNNTYSITLSDAHLRMCKKHKVNTVFTTGWGHGEAGQLSILPSLLQYAEYCYNATVTREDIARRFEQLFDISLDAFLTLDLPNVPAYRDANFISAQCKYLLYNDPLIGMMDKHLRPDDRQTYAKHADAILAHADNSKYGYLFLTLGNLCRVLELKATLSYDTRNAYKSQDKDALCKIANERIPEIRNRLSSFVEAFRAQWLRENKALGLEIHEQYLGGLALRLTTASQRLNDYCDGKIDRIEELEEEPLDFYCYDKERGWPHIDARNWQTIVSAGRI